MTARQRVTVCRLAPGIWVIIHNTTGLCLWHGSDHDGAWRHIDAVRQARTAVLKIGGTFSTGGSGHPKMRDPRNTTTNFTKIGAS